MGFISEGHFLRVFGFFPTVSSILQTFGGSGAVNASFYK